MVRAPLSSVEDADEFMGLVRVKWAFASKRPERRSART